MFKEIGSEGEVTFPYELAAEQEFFVTEVE